jgi:DNA-binding NarL/FixJ family response regulator
VVETKLSILLVEDHLALRKGLELYLRGEGFSIAGVAESVGEGHRLFTDRRPDVVVLDVDLAGQSGVALAERILADEPDAALLIYTGLSDGDSVERAATCGARGFALKTGGPAELLAAIRVVAAGGFYVDPGLARILAPRASAASRLTEREREIFGLLANGLTGERAADVLCLSPETVRTHVRNGMRKLDAKTRAHAIALAVQLREIRL